MNEIEPPTLPPAMPADGAALGSTAADPGGPARPSMADAPLPTYESHSSISTYRGCPLRYGFRYVERLPGEVRPGQYAFGSAVHRAFEVFVRERIRARADGVAGAGPELLRATVDAELDALRPRARRGREARRRAAPVLARFLAMDARREAEPVAVELGFGVDVSIPGGPGAVRFVGYLDRVDRAPDGSTEIVDYKTGRARDQADVDRDTPAHRVRVRRRAGARSATRRPARSSRPRRAWGSTSPTRARSSGRPATRAGSRRSRPSSSRRSSRIRARVPRPAGALALRLVRVREDVRRVGRPCHRWRRMSARAAADGRAADREVLLGPAAALPTGATGGEVRPWSCSS